MAVTRKRTIQMLSKLKIIKLIGMKITIKHKIKKNPKITVLAGILS